MSILKKIKKAFKILKRITLLAVILSLAGFVYFFTKGNYIRVCFQNEDYFLRDGMCIQKIPDFGKKCYSNDECESECYPGKNPEKIQIDDAGFVTGKCSAPTLQSNVGKIRNEPEICTYPESLNIKTPLTDFDTTCL